MRAVAGLVIAGLVLLAGLAAFLASNLMPGADAEQGRLCRMLLPALYAEDDGIRVIASEAGAGSSVHITFRAGGARAPERLLTCRFGGVGYSAAKRDLVAVLIDGVGLGEGALYILKERWLESGFALAADPGPPRLEHAPVQLSRTNAVLLQHVLGGLPRLGILSLLALATALIYGLIGRINLAFGEYAALGGISASLAILLIHALGIENIALLAVFGLIIAAASGALHGAVVGRLVLWPLSKGAGQPLLVAGVGLLLLVQEGLRLAQGARTLWLPPVGAEPFIIAAAPGFDVSVTPRLLIMAGLDLAAVLGTLVYIEKSRLGRAWRAMADDAFAASLCGIDPRRVLVMISALSTLLAALAGATITLNYGGMHFAGGTMPGLTALIAAILGGIGSLGGAVLGALVIGSVQVFWSALQPIASWELASFTLLTLALILKPGGFFGHADGAARKV